MERLTRIILILSLLFVPTWALGETMDARANKVAVTTDEFPVSTPAGNSGMESIADLFLLLDANLLTIVNAETGVADPIITLYDNTSSYTAGIYGTSTVSGDVVMSIGVEDSDAENSPYIELDGVNETVDILKPVTAPAADSGTMFYATIADTTDLATSYSAVCEYVFGNGDNSGNSTWTLPISPLCNDDALYMKKFTFVNNDPTHWLIITPGTGDSIQVRGSQYEVCDADEGLYVEVDRKSVV